MNIKLAAETEYQMMQDFFINGGSLENMPSELRRVRKIWKRSDEILRKFPYYNNEKIAKQLIADLPEYDLSLQTAKFHVTNAKKYYNFVESEVPETQIRILTELAYKQIAILEEQQKLYPAKAHLISKTIETYINRIVSINGGYDKKKETEDKGGDIFLILSSDDTKFEDIDNVTDAELYSTIEEVTKVLDITETEKQKLIDKDVKGNII